MLDDMEIDMSAIIPPYLEKIIPYEPGKPAEELQRELGLSDIVKLASNESPLGPAPEVVEMLADTSLDLHRYPDDSYFKLKEKLSSKFSVDPSNIIVGAGSSEIIVMASRALLGPDDYAVISEQTFIMYWLAVQQVNGNMKTVPLKNYTYDLDAMLKEIDETTKLVFIANPNNPTGTFINAKQFDDFMKRLPPHVTVVYDEAYREYVDDPTYPDPMKYYEEGRNIIILRTFSKIFALAGLRVGYGIMPDHLMDALKRVRPPFNVSTPAAAAAIVALDADDHVAKSVKINNEGREYLVKELQAMNFKVIPSVTNFILVECDCDTKEMFLALQKKGIIIRPMAAFGLANALRISIGWPEENEKLIEALKEIQAC
jgi:histidinol-phosphate aminotransferase